MTYTTVPAIRPRTPSSSPDRGDGREHDAGADAQTADDGDLLAELEGNVVGQRRPVRETHLLFHMHRLSSSPNAIFVGPTGCGKTHTLRVACSALGLPFVSVDASSLVPSGIVGEQVEDVLEILVAAADGMLAASGVHRRRDDDLDLAQRGILLLDEFDKLATPDDLVTSSSQGEKKVVQRRLLKLLEGARLRVGVKRHNDTRPERFIDTSGILVVASGAFTDLPRFGRRTTRVHEGLGQAVASSDIQRLGFLPELIGRLPVVIAFGPLTAKDLVGILDHERVTPLESWRSFLARAFDGRLHVDDAAKWIVAERAAALGLGARGLQQVLFPVLADKIGALRRGKGPYDVTLRASDLLTETVSIPVDAPVQ